MASAHSFSSFVRDGATVHVIGGLGFRGSGSSYAVRFQGLGIFYSTVSSFEAANDLSFKPQHFQVKTIRLSGLKKRF